jgi:hypothetical protein
LQDDDLRLKWQLYTRGLKNSGWDSLLQRSIETVGHIGEAIAKPGPITITKAAMSVARTLTTSDLYYGEVLDPRQWKPMFPSCIKAQLLEVLEPRVTSKVNVSSSGDTIAYLITAEGGIRIGWVKDGEDGVATEILAHVDNFDKSVEFARNLLWKTVDASRIVLSSAVPNQEGNKGPRRGRGEYGQLRVSTDDLVIAAPSQFATDYAAYLKKHAELGHNRTVLFYGPPGTGKSTISRTLCDVLKLRSLRVRVEDVGSLGSEPVVEMMRIFNPDVVIFDDLDRAMSQVALLETLENLHKRIRFVFATVNHIENLQQALIRPGRFDELIEITKLDEAAVRKVLGAEYMDSFEAVKDWPIAFINEYVLRRKVLGKDKALAALDELRGRVDRLMGNADEDGPQEPESEEPW